MEGHGVIELEDQNQEEYQDEEDEDEDDEDVEEDEDDDDYEEEEDDEDYEEDEPILAEIGSPRVLNSITRAGTSQEEVVVIDEGLVDGSNDLMSFKGKLGSQENCGNDGEGEDLFNRGEIDGLFCPICIEAWTSGGEHQICCLPCGHIYGLSCIQKWLKQRRSSGKCPQCNSKCTLKDVRVLYATRLCVVDAELQKKARLLEAKCASLEEEVISCEDTETQIEKMKQRYDKMLEEVHQKLRPMQERVEQVEREVYMTARRHEELAFISEQRLGGACGPSRRCHEGIPRYCPRPCSSIPSVSPHPASGIFSKLCISTAQSGEHEWATATATAGI